MSYKKYKKYKNRKNKNKQAGQNRDCQCVVLFLFDVFGKHIIHAISKQLSVMLYQHLSRKFRIYIYTS